MEETACDQTIETLPAPYAGGSGGEYLPLVPADADQLIQATLNLVINALQAVDRNGQVEITAQAEAESVRLEVRDTGPGVAEESLSGASIDISKEGISIITDCLLFKGDVVFFEPEIKVHDIREKSAIVRWVKEIEKNKYRIGLMFI